MGALTALRHQDRTLPEGLYTGIADSWRSNTEGMPMIDPVPGFNCWQEHRGVTFAFAADDDIALLDQLYLFADYATVAAFLRRNPYLIVLLLEARSKIDEHFGPGTPTALEVFADPEAIDSRQLFAIIRSRLPVEEAINRLAELDRTWWLKAVPLARQRLTIDVECL